MYYEFTVSTKSYEELIDITHNVEGVIQRSAVKDGVCIVYIPHATAGIILNESADPNIKRDFLSALDRVIPKHAGYLHDRIDNNAHAHIKSAIVGSSVTIPVSNGHLGLGTWQAIMLCEFDGPRARRRVVIKIIAGD
ncbi:MAG: secondary thiamine-phosphate synthase enzyme YjbQ [candidate division WOR-3 bacterium]|nr:secondary thiamine-phosphate synthase enzyme YjbQ [candidate division WOR-3 bacterium]